MTHQVVYPVMSKQKPYSPRGVVDMALFHLDDDKLLLHECLLLPPPLNSVSVCSSATNTADDSSTTVSSLEADDDENCWEQESQSPSRRCIFGPYWKAKGGRPKEPLRGSCSEVAPASPFKTTEDDLPPASLMTGDCSEDDSPLSSLSPLSPQEDPAGNYEDLLEQSATSISRRPAAAPLLGDDSGTSLGSSRRRLFGDNHYSKSAPSLPQCVALPSDCMRKTQSSRGLEERRPSSCLKECRRYSGTITAASRRPSKATSVSFSDDVEVKYVQKPKVFFAEKGWSKYFM